MIGRFPCCEGAEVSVVVWLGKHALSVLAAVDEVRGSMGHDESGVSRHGGIPFHATDPVVSLNRGTHVEPYEK